MPTSMTCLKCGTVFQVPPSHAKRTRYCSKACAGNGTRVAHPVEDRFWSKVNKDGPVIRPDLGPCHVWTGRTDAEGYGRFDPDNEHKNASAHRFSYSLKIGGPIPDGVDVLHTCDNPPCVRWEHLFPGDALANMQDAAKKNRTASGERHPKAVLTEQEVQEIRQEFAEGWPQATLARYHGVGISTLHAIVIGTHWRRTDGPVSETRQRRGGPVKLTSEEIAMIRSSPLSDIELGKQLGVSRITVYNVRTGRTWKNHP